MNRPNVDENLDPINLDKMPSLDGLGLDYRTGGSALFSGPLSPTTAFFPYAVLAVLVSLGLRLLSFVLSPNTAFTWATVFGVIVAALVYAGSGLGRGSHRAALSWLLLGPVFWVGLQIAQSTALAVPAYALLFVTFWFILRETRLVASHFLHWNLADTRIRPEETEALRAAWDGNSPDDPPETVKPVVEALELYRRGRRPLILALLIGAPVLFIALLAGYTVFAVMLAVFAMLGALLFANYRRSQALGFGRTVAATSDVLGNYFTYNERGIEAPGLFRSPAGKAFSRSASLLQTLLALALIAVPASSYFPLVPLLTGSSPWALVYIEQHEHEFPLAEAMTRNEALRHLTPDQRTNYNHRTGADKDAYLDRIIEDDYRYRRALQVERGQREVAKAISANPEAWVGLAVRGVATGNQMFVWAIVLAIILSIAVPPALFFFAIVLTAGPFLAALHRFHGELEDTPERNVDSAQNKWDTYVERIQSSGRRVRTDDGRVDDENRLRDHLWLGTAVRNDYPVLLHRDVLHDHAWFLGNSGSGKTSLGLSPLLTQLIRLAPKLLTEQLARDIPSRKPNHLPPTVVVLDFKGEPYLFHGVKKEADNAGLPFKHFTNVQGQSTHAFNPFLQSYMQNVSTEQMAALLLQSLGLEHGEGYGPSHYSLAHASVLTRTLAANPDIQSFVELRDILDTPGKRTRSLHKLQEDSGDLHAIVHSLATHNALNLVPDAEDPLPQKLLDRGIDLQAALESPQVLYFYVPATLEEATVRRIGRLILYSLLVAAESFERTHGHPPRVYVFIDEFQQVVSRNLQLFLRMARSKGLSMVLSNQTSSDLKFHTDDFAPVVRGNTRFKQYFAASDLSLAKELIEASGEGWFSSYSHTTKGDGDSSTTMREERGPRLSKNDILGVTDHPTQSIVDIARGSGFSQFKGRPFILDTTYHISLAEKEAREQAPWPAVEPGKTMAAGSAQPKSPPGKGPRQTQETEPPPPRRSSPLDRSIDSWQRGSEEGDDSK